MVKLTLTSAASEQRASIFNSTWRDTQYHSLIVLSLSLTQCTFSFSVCPPPPPPPLSHCLSLSVSDTIL